MDGLRRDKAAFPDAGTPVDRQTRTEVEAALAHEIRFQERLSQALTVDVPEQGLADVLHEHLGLAVAVEDPFGRVLARAGADRQVPYPPWTSAQTEYPVFATCTAFPVNASAFVNHAEWKTSLPVPRRP